MVQGKKYNLDLELKRCIGAESTAIPDRVMTPIDGVGENLIVMGYEYGAVCKDYIYNARSEDEDVMRARCANAIVECEDIICQALIAVAKLAKQTKSYADFTVEQIVHEGLERQQYRMQEIREKQIDLSK